MGDRRRVGEAVAAGADHFVTHGDLLDRHLTGGRGHLRAWREALVGVPDDADVAVLGGQEEDELVLDRVRVLVLVDQHVVEPRR